MTTWAVIMVNPSKAEGLFSPCGLYRYRAERSLAGVDVQQNDPTVRKVLGFAARNGADDIIIGNKFALIATDVKELKKAADPIGPDNDTHIEQILRDADMHFVAWGPLGNVAIAKRVGCKLHCFGTAQDGHPRHPLMLAYDTPITEWVTP